MKEIDIQYLCDLGHKIQILPPDEASPLLLEASTILLLAGFPEFAYQGFMKLTQGELKISEASSLVHPIKEVMPALSYFLKIPCPSIFSEQEISFSELEKYINRKLQEYEEMSSRERWLYLPMPSDDWIKNYLHSLTHLIVDAKGDDSAKVWQCLQDLHRLISHHIHNGKWQEASKWLNVFEDLLDTWKLDCLSYIEQELLVFGVRTYLHLEDTSSADRFIQRLWQPSDASMGALYLVAYLPDLMTRISKGVLRNKINLSQEQAQDFLDLVNRRNYIPTSVGFIPTVDDWENLLEKWNEAILNKLDAEHLENYKSQYADVLARKRCLQASATEEEVFELEKRLGEKLPLGYRNFLLASNGFVILNEYCELHGTGQIKWFIEENQDWADCWNDVDDVADEKYFQYGAHQDCCSMRGSYMKTALQISSTDDGDVYLLNPQIIDSRNEWEAWDFGNKNPGAYRYRSFWDMIQALYKKSIAS